MNSARSIWVLANSLAAASALSGPIQAVSRYSIVTANGHYSSPPFQTESSTFETYSFDPFNHRATAGNNWATQNSAVAGDSVSISSEAVCGSGPSHIGWIGSSRTLFTFVFDLKERARIELVGSVFEYPGGNLNVVSLSGPQTEYLLSSYEYLSPAPVDFVANVPAGRYTFQVLCDMSSGGLAGNSANVELHAESIPCVTTTATILNTQIATFPGLPVTIPVAAPDGANTFQWRRNQIPLSNGGNITGTQSPFLEIASVGALDAGSYDCIVTNNCGTVTSNAAELSCKPVIVAHPPAHMPLRAALQISVDVPDFAPYAFRWFRNGIAISDSPGSISGATTKSLQFLSSDYTLGGTFTCQLTDACGITVSNACKICLADFTADELVDDADFIEFGHAYDTMSCANPSMAAGCPADINNDSFVDDADFILFVGAYIEMLCP